MYKLILVAALWWSRGGAAGEREAMTSGLTTESADGKQSPRNLQLLVNHRQPLLVLKHEKRVFPDFEFKVLEERVTRSQAHHQRPECLPRLWHKSKRSPCLQPARDVACRLLQDTPRGELGFRSFACFARGFVLEPSLLGTNTHLV
jgi:hypothetical protein